MEKNSSKFFLKIIPVFVFFILIFSSRSDLFAQQIPICSAPQHLVIWPNMATYTIPMADNSRGILRSSPIRFSIPTSSNDLRQISIFGTMFISGKNSNWYDQSEYAANWVTIHRGPLELTGPRKDYNSGGAIRFIDLSMTTTRDYQTIFSISQYPLITYSTSGQPSISQIREVLSFHYGEFNPNDYPVTSTNFRQSIPSGWTISNRNLMNLTWDGKLGLGTTTPQAKLHVIGNILSSGTITAPRICLNNDCRTSWPTQGTSYWALSNNNLYATPTNVRVGIGTTTPRAQLDVPSGAVFNAIAIGTTPFGQLSLGNYGYESIQLPSWANLRINFATTQVMIITNRGNVGIGTTTPQAQLHVIGNILSSGTITAPRICLNNDCRTSWPTQGTSYWILSNNNLYAPTTVNVGIGTTNPQAKLHVFGYSIFQSNGASIRLQGTDHIYLEFYPQGISSRFGYLGYGSVNTNHLTLKNERTGGELYLLANQRLLLGTFSGSNEQYHLTIASSGRVGIGTTTPRAKLHVVGDILMDRFSNNYSSGIIFSTGNQNNWRIDLAQGSGGYLVISKATGTASGEPVITFDSDSRGSPRLHIGDRIRSDSNAKLNVYGRVRVYSFDGSRLLFEVDEE